MSFIRVAGSTVGTGRVSFLPACTSSYLYAAVGDFGYPRPIIRAFNKTTLSAIDDYTFPLYGIEQLLVISDSLIFTKRRSSETVIDYILFNGTTLSVQYSWEIATIATIAYYNNYIYTIVGNTITSIDIINRTTRVEYTFPSTFYGGRTVTIRGNKLLASLADSPSASLFYMFTINGDNTLSYITDLTVTNFLSTSTYMDSALNIYAAGTSSPSAKTVYITFNGTTLTLIGDVIPDPLALYAGSLTSGVNFTDVYLTYISCINLSIFTFNGLYQNIVCESLTYTSGQVGTVIDPNNRYLYVASNTTNTIEKYQINECRGSMTVDFTKSR